MYLYNLEFSMVFIITETVYICLGASWRTPPGARISRCVDDLLVTFCCCLIYGRVVVSLAHSPFPFSTLKIFYTTFDISKSIDDMLFYAD